MMSINRLLLVFCILTLTWTFNLVPEQPLTQRGSGATQQEEAYFVEMIQYQFKVEPNKLFACTAFIQKVMKDRFQFQWVVESIAFGQGLQTARAGLKIKADKWITFNYQNAYLFWIMVPESSNAQMPHLAIQKAQTNLDMSSLPEKSKNKGNAQNKGEVQNKGSVQNKGIGISENQQIAIQKIIQNAELAKGKSLQANAEFIEQKLEDSYGQNWTVEIYSISDLDLVRVGLKIKNSQWLEYEFYGSFYWEYFIMVSDY